MYAIHDAMADLFQSSWNDKTTQYLAERGVSPEMRKAFGIGVCPSQQTCVAALDRWQFLRSLAETVGFLSFKGPTPYCGFADRLMFPISSARGQIVAFGGRTLNGGPKYINSPETPIYRKREHLFGFHQALNAIRHKRRVIVVEGYLDCIALHQAGLTETVAVCGTAFSEYQSHLFEQLGVTVHLLFDADSAGVEAAKRFEATAKSRNLKHNIVTLPSGDPDTFVKEYGPQGIEDLLVSKK
jgi:DNA primase